jgi:FixJ family two-component response regulator
MRAATTIFILENDPGEMRFLGRTLRAAGYSVRGFSTAPGFLDAHDAEVPGCLVTDIGPQGMSGPQLQKVLAARCQRPVIFLAQVADIRTTVQVMKAGAVTLLPRPLRSEELLEAVAEGVARDAASRRLQLEQRAIAGRLSMLTPRERQVLELVTSGKPNKEIAIELGAAVKTVKVHRGRIMEKMQVRGATALVGLMVRSGIAQPL